MKRILLSMAMLIAIPAFAICQMNDKNANKKGGDEQAVRQVLNDLANALKNNDVVALDRIYADTFTFTSDFGVVTTKSQRFDAIKSGKLKFESISFDDVKIQMYGDAAVATFRVTSKSVANGKSLGGNYRVTSTFVKSKGRWQEVAAQSTPIVEQ